MNLSELATPEHLLTTTLFLGIVLLIGAFIRFHYKNKEYERLYRSKNKNGKISYNQREILKGKNFEIFYLLISLIITSMLFLSTLTISSQSLFIQNEVAKEQIKTLRQGYSQNWPTLDIYVKYLNDKNYFEFSKNELTGNRGNFENGFNVIMINTGKIKSGMLSIIDRENNNSLFLYDKEETQKTLYNGIGSQEAIRFTINIKQSGCDSNTLKGCDKNTLKTGINPIKLSFSCEFCKEDYIEIPVNICIWEKSSSECKQ